MNKKLKLTFRGISTASIFTFFYWFGNYFMPWFYSVGHSGIEGFVNASILIMTPFLSLVILLKITRLPNYFLGKVNADHKLKEFDLERVVLKLIAKEDIESNGFFSAAGYWKFYFQDKYYDANTNTLELRR